MGAGGSHPQATMMPDPWATYERPSANEGQATTDVPPETNKGTFALTKGFRKARSRSATRNMETRSMVDEALDFYVKATGRDGTQKREELVNMRPGELRRSLERWQAHAKEVQRLQEKKSNARRRRTSRRTSGIRWCTTATWMRKDCGSGQTRCSPRSRQPSVSLKLERESGWSRRTPIPKVAEHGRSSGKQEPSPHRHTFLRFSDDSTTFAVAVQSASDMNRLLVQINQALMTSLHSRHEETCSAQVHSSIPKSERSTSTDFMTRSAKKLMVEPSATMDLGIDSDVIQDVSSSTRISCGVHPARAHVSDCICDSDRDWHFQEQGRHSRRVATASLLSGFTTRFRVDVSFRANLEPLRLLELMSSMVTRRKRRRQSLCGAETTLVSRVALVCCVAERVHLVQQDTVLIL